MLRARPRAMENYGAAVRTDSRVSRVALGAVAVALALALALLARSRPKRDERVAEEGAEGATTPMPRRRNAPT